MQQKFQIQWNKYIKKERKFIIIHIVMKLILAKIINTQIVKINYDIHISFDVRRITNNIEMYLKSFLNKYSHCFSFLGFFC